MVDIDKPDEEGGFGNAFAAFLGALFICGCWMLFLVAFFKVVEMTGCTPFTPVEGGPIFTPSF